MFNMFAALSPLSSDDFSAVSRHHLHHFSIRLGGGTNSYLLPFDASQVALL